MCESAEIGRQSMLPPASLAEMVGCGDRRRQVVVRVPFRRAERLNPPPPYGISPRALAWGAPRRCRSSVVEHSLGKGEVDSSILSGSTISSVLVGRRSDDCASSWTVVGDRDDRGNRSVRPETVTSRECDRKTQYLFSRCMFSRMIERHQSAWPGAVRSGSHALIANTTSSLFTER